jgi:hypothetical protein
MPHIVLVGDSIFDNAAYVPGGPCVIEQLGQWLGPQWKATLLAIDGAAACDVGRQLERMPADATHLCVSAGGNDALQNSNILYEENLGAAAAFDLLAAAQSKFRADYERMLRSVLECELPTITCTVYDSIPGLQPREKTALATFNDVILSSAIQHRLPVLDLRAVCREPRDYAEISPIEPSEAGGAKIVQGLKNIVLSHDFSSRQTVIYH